MNVIGIIQTDLNEFSVLFDQQQGDHNGQQQQSQDNNEENDSMFLGFLDEPSNGHNSKSSSQSGGQQNGQQQNGPQEMTVRIKGIPEGQKANFLQMYQILQDAQDTQSLNQSLTIVQQGDEQGQQGRSKGNKNESSQSSNPMQ
ncbi:hypothetical protein [Brevibacillus invocatus]|uniref:hypothetical protein n=1 Tax=Brevibacillus invocatus TaxID=173959 RepID=UPI00203C0D52|nr:hypothetical protein [Brevibacillus invocatus]MCM3079919.1 hypothetical protein [Brevibacillus invocatus]MCM3430112.1 hypothetical protein [Brevibacillus invocatus]